MFLSEVMLGVNCGMKIRVFEAGSSWMGLKRSVFIMFYLI